MRIDFDDGSYLQVNSEDSFVSLLLCAKKDKKVLMSSVRLNSEQTQQLAEELNGWLKGNNEQAT